jgi:hypothetical protein
MLYLFRSYDLLKNKTKLIYYDSKGFNPKKITADEYFQISPENNKKITPVKGETHVHTIEKETSRDLNHTQDNNNILQLKDNEPALQENNNVITNNYMNQDASEEMNTEIVLHKAETSFNERIISLDDYY